MAHHAADERILNEQ